MTTAKPSILFACTQNAVRSVMAKALYETRPTAQNRQAASCGIIEGPLDGFTVSVLLESGLDVGAHQAQVFEALDPAQFDLLISFSKEAEDKAKRWAKPDCTTLFWDVRPPHTNERSRDETLASYRQTRDEIDRLLTGFFENNG